jgi:hypothetical protein
MNGRRKHARSIKRRAKPREWEKSTALPTPVAYDGHQWYPPPRRSSGQPSLPRTARHAGQEWRYDNL